MPDPARAWRPGGPNCAQALGLGGGSLSLYQLTIEPGTAFEAQTGAASSCCRTAMPRRRCTSDGGGGGALGLLAYEVSNYARPGAESRHNLTYWRYGDYAGIGLAHMGGSARRRPARHPPPSRAGSRGPGGWSRRPRG